MSSNSRRRVLNDYKQLLNEKDNGIYVFLNLNNVLLCDAVIIGPENSIWEGGVFKLSIEFPEEYPIKPPTVRFKTPIFHPNGNFYLF